MTEHRHTIEPPHAVANQMAALLAEIEKLRDTMESCIELLRDDKVNRAVMRMRAALKGGDNG